MTGDASSVSAAEGTTLTTDDHAAQSVRDHRLQPRIRSSDGPPQQDYECLCGEFFMGVAEWSYHAAAAVRAALAAGPSTDTSHDTTLRALTRDEVIDLCESVWEDEPTAAEIALVGRILGELRALLAGAATEDTHHD